MRTVYYGVRRKATKSTRRIATYHGGGGSLDEAMTKLIHGGERMNADGEKDARDSVCCVWGKGRAT